MAKALHAMIRHQMRLENLDKPSMANDMARVITRKAVLKSALVRGEGWFYLEEAKRDAFAWDELTERQQYSLDNE